MSAELALSLLSILVTLLLGLLVWHNSRRSNQVADKKVTVEEQALEDAREDVIAKRRAEELDRLYERVEKLENEGEERDTELRVLRSHARDSETRELLLYHHVKDLRAHILRGDPPPPPKMPPDLVAWFETFGITEPPHLLPRVDPQGGE